MPSDLITPEEVSKILHVKVGTLATWRHSGSVDLAFYKIGKAVRYSRAEVEQFLAASRVGPEDYAMGMEP